MYKDSDEVGLRQDTLETDRETAPVSRQYSLVFVFRRRSIVYAN